LIGALLVGAAIGRGLAWTWNIPAIGVHHMEGHLLAPMLMFVFVRWRPDPWLMASFFAAGCVALSLFLLPRIKGTMIGLQWAKRMHGFGGDRDD
jgi:uncharacterized protein (DUF983 family)